MSETTNFTLRLPQHLRRRLEHAAKKEGRTPSGFIRYHIKKQLDETKKPQPRPH